MRSKRDIFTVLTSCCTHRNFLISLSVSMANKMLPIRVCRQLPSALIRRHLRDKNRSVASDDSHLLRHDTLLLLRLPSSQRTDRGAKNEWVIWECFHVFMSNPATRWCPKIQANVYRSKFSIPNCRLLSLMGFRTVITLLCWPCIMGRQSSLSLAPRKPQVAAEQVLRLRSLNDYITHRFRHDALRILGF